MHPNSVDTKREATLIATGKANKGGQMGGSRQRKKTTAHLLFPNLLLVLLCSCYGLAVNAATIPVPNGNGGQSISNPLRKIVSDWMTGAKPYKVPVVNKYGELPDWDLSQVTNLDYIFLNRPTFNADLSKWNTSTVTTMYGSKCTHYN